MTNPMYKPVKVMLDKERNLLFTTYSTYWLSEIYEDPIEPFKVISDLKLKSGADLILTKKEYKAIFSILVSGLIHEDENLTVKKLMELIPPYAIKDALDGISTAINLHFSKPESTVEEKGENPQ